MVLWDPAPYIEKLGGVLPTWALGNDPTDLSFVLDPAVVLELVATSLGHSQGNSLENTLTQ